MKLTDLTAQFEQERDEILQKAKEIESAELRKFEAALKQQLASAATTLSSALESVQTEAVEDIKTFRSSLGTALSTDSNALAEQLGKVASAVHDWTPKMLKTIKFAILAPILITAALCGMFVATTLAWWRLENRYRVQMRPFVTERNENLMIVDEPTWTYCNEQTITDKNGKKTIYVERCRKEE